MADVFDLIEKGKIKRYFRARNKCYFEGAVSHITQHASGREPLFLEDSDYLYMLHLMKEVLGAFKCKVLSFALMPNHIHLLLKFLESNMPDALKELLQRYAVYFNKKYQRKGHVFCGAYRSALCLDDDYLLAASLYIHLNPVKSKLVSDPIDYRWSSCALFLKDATRDTFIDYAFVLNILDNDISIARSRYKDILYKLNVMDIGNVFEQRNGLHTMMRILKESNGMWPKEHGLLGDEDLKEKIEALMTKGNLRGPQERHARKYLVEQLKARGFSIVEISEKLNLSRMAIYQYLKQ